MIWMALSMGGDFGAEFGGTEKIFVDQMKNFHFNTLNFWWPFLVIDSILSFFCLSLSLKSDI